MNQKPKIGLALGGGASRGFAHIGVIQVLEDIGIKPDYIAGSSMGAIIGALYAAGATPYMIEGIANNVNAKLCYDVGFSRKGLIRGKRLEELIQLLTRNMDFRDLPIPLGVTAVDLITNERVVINEGKVYKGVRASVSIPGIFHPVPDGDRVLIDGGILERVPVRVVREMGADIVIGVDVAFHGKHRPPENFVETILQAIEAMDLEILKLTIPTDDIMIRPEVYLPNPMSLENVDVAVEAGKEAALKSVDQLKTLVQGQDPEQPEPGK